MNSGLFFLGLLGCWLLFRIVLWRRSNQAARKRIEAGETELAVEQSKKQPLIYLSVVSICAVEITRFSGEPHPAMTYMGLAIWCLGLAVLMRQVQIEGVNWTERLFADTRASGNPTAAQSNRKPWIPWWPLRLELVGLALFCGAPVGALTAWVFCMAHARAIQATWARIED